MGLAVGLVFCCFGGGAFAPFDGLDFLMPLDPKDDFLEPLLFSDLLAANLERTVLVGAILSLPRFRFGPLGIAVEANLGETGMTKHSSHADLRH